MSSADRLFYPLESGVIARDGDARIAVLRAKPSIRLSKVAGVEVTQSFKPYADRLVRSGIPVSENVEPELDICAIEITRSKIENMGLIAKALAVLKDGGWCIVDGAKTDGIDSVFKLVRQNFDGLESYSKAHGRVFWFQKPAKTVDAVSSWQDSMAPREVAAGYVTVPGIFSEKGPDEGSRVLLENLPKSLSGAGADLGAGWGWLSGEALKSRPDISSLDLFEAEANALSCAALSLRDGRVQFHWTDVTQDKLGRFDFVLMNPPFHTGRTADPGLGHAFIRAAAQALNPTGTLYMVANKHLPYEEALKATFSHWEEVATTPRYKVIFAKRPKT